MGEDSGKQIRLRRETYELLEEFKTTDLPDWEPGLGKMTFDRAVQLAIYRAMEVTRPELREARKANERSLRKFIKQQERVYRAAGGV